MVALKTKLVPQIHTYQHPQTSEIRCFDELKSGANIEVYEYYNKTDLDEHKSFNIANIWVPVFSRGSGIGSALLRAVLHYYDDRGENLRLVAAGCCAPNRLTTADEVAVMHRGDGHFEYCQDQYERLSHHGLQRWYRSFGFVDHPEGRGVDEALCCDYLLWRAHG